METGIERITDESSLDGDEADTTEVRGTLAPFVELSAKGRRSSASLSARLLASASDETDGSDIRPSLSATSTVFSASRQLKFDTTASIQQRTVNSPYLSQNEIFNASARERVVSVAAGPSFKQDFDRVQVVSTYRVGKTTSSETENSSSLIQAAAVESRALLSDPKWLAGIRLSGQHTAFDSAPSAISSSVVLYTGYQIRRNLTGRFGIGRDFLDIDDDSVDQDSNLWLLGLNWKSGGMLQVDASYAERSFGRQPRVSIQMNGRRSSVELSWTRTSNLSEAADNALLSLSSPDIADELTDDTAENSAVGAELDGNNDIASLPLFQESYNIDENITLSYSLSGRVSAFTASVSRVVQENLVLADTSESTLLQLGLSRKLSLASTVLLQLGIGESEGSGDSQTARSESRSSRIGLQWNLRF